MATVILHHLRWIYVGKKREFSFLITIITDLGFFTRYRITVATHKPKTSTLTEFGVTEFSHQSIDMVLNTSCCNIAQHVVTQWVFPPFRGIVHSNPCYLYDFPILYLKYELQVTYCPKYILQLNCIACYNPRGIPAVQGHSHSNPPSLLYL